MLTFAFNGAQGYMTEPEVLTSGMAGKKVKFLFSAEWEGLIKTAVYMAGDSCVIHPQVGTEDVIPAQVLAQPLNRLRVGIYGQSPDGQTLIPTVRAEGPEILPGVEPQGDPETAEELPAWARILQQIGNLENLRGPRQDSLVEAINSLVGSEENTGHIFEGRQAVLFGDNMVREDDQNTSGFHHVLRRQLGLSACMYSGESDVTLADAAGWIWAGSGQENLVLVLAGIGDLSRSVPLGSPEDRNGNTIYGSAELLCRALLEKYPRAVHTVITPPFQSRYIHKDGVTSGDVGQVLVEVCGRHGIPVYDYGRLGGVTEGNLELLTRDYCHWNTNGQQMAGRNIARFLENNFRYWWCDLTPEPIPVGIRAEFNPEQTVFYDRDSLEILKDYLKVYVVYRDGTRKEIPLYTLSGELWAPESTITVSWREHTDSFTVTVLPAKSYEPGA